MSCSCSSETNETVSLVCPVCEEQGIECVGPKKVPEITVTSLVKPEHHRDIPSGPFYFCQQKECDAVYFDSQGHEIRKNQLVVGVWQKEEARDVPVCYCFDHTAADIMEDARQNSPPTIPLSIREKIQAGCPGPAILM